MLKVDRNGRLLNPGIIWRQFLNLERGDMKTVAGIIVHQTDSSTAASTLAQYKTSAIGAHFLIDKDGTLYQTASVLKRVNHVGRLKARCIEEHTCASGEKKRLNP